MEKLNQRQKEFLELLLQETDYAAVQSFADKLGVSGKTLKEDLKVLRVFLEKYNGKIMTKTGKGVCLTRETRSSTELRDFLSREKEKKEAVPGERRAEILKNMLMHSERSISLQKLSEQYYVGKTSIVNDLKYIEEWLNRYGLYLEKTKHGTRIAGEERNIREAITSLLCQTDFPGERRDIGFAEGFHLDRDTVYGLLEIFEPEDIVFVVELLEEVQTGETLGASDIYYKNLLTHILICIQRVREGKRVDGQTKERFRETAKKRDGYEKAVRISRGIQKRYGVDIGEEETYYIYQYICSLITQEKTVQGLQGEENFSSRVAESLTEYMEQILGVKFIREEMLMEGLLLHIRPLLNRLEYQIKIANPLLEEMQKSYPQILGICQIACALVGRKYGLGFISLDEIGNLATYYQTALVKQTNPVSAVVVCHSGYGTSQLLEAMLKQQFPNLNIRAVVSVRKLKQMELKETDFIISTVPVDAGKLPHLIVSSFLTDKDISAIRDTIDIASRKREKGYARITSMLTEESVFTDTCQAEGEKILVSAALTENLRVCIREEKGEGRLNLYVNHKTKQIRFDICTLEDEMITALLSEIYRMSLEEKQINAVFACRDSRAILNYLGGGREQENSTELLREENVILDREAKTKEEVIRILTKHILTENGVTDETEIVKAVAQREKLAFTGIGKRTALVHAVTAGVKEAKAVFLRTASPVDWAKGKDYPEEAKMIRIALLLLIPKKEQSREEIEKVKQLVLKLGKKENARRLLEVSTKQEVLKILNGEVRK